MDSKPLKTEQSPVRPPGSPRGHPPPPKVEGAAGGVNSDDSDDSYVIAGPNEWLIEDEVRGKYIAGRHLIASGEPINIPMDQLIPTGEKLWKIKPGSRGRRIPLNPQWGAQVKEEEQVGRPLDTEVKLEGPLDPEVNE